MMTIEQIETALALRDCSVVEDKGDFALVYPDGYGSTRRAYTLAASTREAALTEAWLWMHPDLHGARSVEIVIGVVAADYAMIAPALRARPRTEPVATARRVAMALCRELTGSPLQVIGDAFGRDHHTVIYAHRSVEAQCATEPAFAARVGALRAACVTALKNPL